jgi:hypothetical protein
MKNGMRPVGSMMLAAAVFLAGGDAFGQAENFENYAPPPAGYGAQGTLIQMCNEDNVLAAQRECQAKIRYYENTIRDFDRRKARADTDATAKQVQWLRGLQYDLTQYRQACAKIEDGLRQLRAHPQTRCDASGRPLKQD